jgi:WsaF, C-terminal domain/WsaF, N-terminal domain
MSQLELARNGASPPSPARADGPRQLSIATVIPSFRRGSGGHATIVALLRELRSLGSEMSLWLEDCEGRHARESPLTTKRAFAEFFGADAPELHVGFEEWHGADVVLATGWQTVARALMLDGVGSRAYLVQDHEPDFYGASAEAMWAEETYRRGLHCIAASGWLAQLLRSRYGARASHFDLALDHEVYRAAPAEARRDDLVVFYARAVTPRRAVPLGLLALSELARRRPQVQVALFGEDRGLDVPFEHLDTGVLGGPALARLYSQATVGMVLSLTNPSLVALEMMACGLPAVELASESMLASFDPDGPLELARPDPLALCDAIERLLDDPQRRRRASRDGLELAAQRTWARAAASVHESLLAELAALR